MVHLKSYQSRVFALLGHFIEGSANETTKTMYISLVDKWNNETIVEKSLNYDWQNLIPIQRQCQIF